MGLFDSFREWFVNVSGSHQADYFAEKGCVQPVDGIQGGKRAIARVGLLDSPKEPGGKENGP